MKKCGRCRRENRILFVTRIYRDNEESFYESEWCGQCVDHGWWGSMADKKDLDKDLLR